MPATGSGSRAPFGGGDATASPEDAAAYRRLRHATLSAERRRLVALRDRGEISDEVLHRLEHELDVEAVLIGTGQLRPT